MDKCTLTLLDKKPLYKRFRAHLSGKSDSVGPVSVEICCLFDSLLRVPTKVVFSKCDTSEFKMFPRLKKHLKVTDLVLMDNGFYSFKNFSHILSRGAHFIVPLDTMSRPKVETKITKDDYICTITDSKSKETMKVRIIYVYMKGFRRRRIATSLLDEQEYPREEIGNIYHQRWHIETYYREFKSSMNAQKWHCGKVDSFIKELYAKIILSCIVRLAANEAINDTKLTVNDISFIRALHFTRCLLMELSFNPNLSYEEKWTQLLLLIKNKARARIKPNRHFSRDKQEYRKKSRGLLKGKVGRPRKKSTPVPEEERARTIENGNLEKQYNYLVA